MSFKIGHLCSQAPPSEQKGDDEDQSNDGGPTRVNNNERNPFLTGLYIEEQLPLHWSSAPAAVDAATRRSEGNLRLLRLLNLLHEWDSQRVFEPDEKRSDIERLEVKLDLVIALLADLASQRREPLPHVDVVKIGTDGIEWLEPDGRPPDVGEQLSLALYLDRRLPAPLELYVEVVGIEMADDGAVWVRVVPSHWGVAVRDQLERLILENIGGKLQ